MSRQRRHLQVSVLSRLRGAVLVAALSLPVAVLAAVAVPASSLAQVVGTPIPVGLVAEGVGQPVAVDSVTGVVFVANVQNGTVEAVSEASQSVVADINVGGAGYGPVAVAVDPVSGTVYVTEIGPPARVLVITEDPGDPAGDQVTATVTVPQGTEGFDGPEGIAVLPGSAPGTGTVYVTNGAGDFVSVISEATNTVTSLIPIPAENGSDDSYPMGITADPADGLVYVADQNDGDISVISGTSLAGSFPLPLAGGATVVDPTAIAADPVTGTVYVTVPAPLPAGTVSPTVDVIQEDPASPADASVVAAIPVPAFGDSGAPYGVPEGIAVNPAAASVYVSNYEGALDVINEDTADPAADAFNPQAIALDPSYSDFDEVYPLAVDTSTGNPWSGIAYVVSDQTQDMYPVSFPPPLQSQSISFTAPATGTVGGSATLTATGGGSGNPVVFTVDSTSGNGVCSVSGTNGSTVSYLAAGACVIDANQAGNAGYSAAPQVQQTITVSPASQSISFTAPANGTISGSATLTATGGGSGNPVVFSVDSSSGNGVCNVSGTNGTTVNYTAAGSCVIDANQAGNADYTAAPQVQQSIMVEPGLSVSGSPPGGLVGSAYSYPLTASGGVGPYTFSAPASDLPAGLSLSAAGMLEGTPTAAGLFTVPVTVTDSESPPYSLTQSFTITVALETGPASLPDGYTGETYDQQLTATGDGNLLDWQDLGNLGLPPGLELTESGLIAGTPNTTGTFSFTATVYGPGGASGVYNGTITIQPGPQSIIVTAPATGTVGQSATLTPTGGESGNPVVLTVDSSSGSGVCSLSGDVVSYTAAGSCVIDANQAGNANYLPAPQVQQAITVYQATVITSAAAATFTGGTSGLFTVTATGSPTPAISEAGPLPAGVTFTSNGNGTATLSGTPAASAGGTYMVTLTASNGLAAAVTQSFVLTVTQAPAITSASTASVSSGAVFSFTVSATGTPTPTLTHTGALPPGITFTAGASGTATLAGVATSAAHGAYPITFTAKNAAGTASQGFTLTVTAAPAISSAATVTETAGTAFSYLVTTTGYPTPALSTGTLPSGLTFADNKNGTGTLSGTAAPGTYTIALTAASSAGTTSQTITLTVKAAAGTESVPAFTSAATANATVGTATSLTVTTTGSPTTYTTNVTHTGTLPAGITFTNNGNGTATLSGTPTAAGGGSYPITLTAKNTAGTVTQAFVLTVDATPAITTGTSATATAGAGFSFTVSATGTPAPAMTEAGTLPQGLTWTDNGNGTATLAGTPAAGQGAVYTLTLAATNSLGSGTQTFTLTVDQVPTITSATTASAPPGQAFTFTFTATGYPLPAITHTGSVPGLTFAGGTGTATLSGTPTKAGTYTLVITAKNAVGTATEAFTLTVT